MTSCACGTPVPEPVLMDASPERLIAHYTEAVSNSVLPVGLYDRGRHSSVVVPGEVFAEVIKDKKVSIVKDSTSDPERMKLFLSLRDKYSHIKSFDGDEFACLNYLKAGDLALAEKIENRMIRVALAMYGGKQIKCWLTGLKTLLVALKVFGTAKTYFEQPMTASCRKAIDGLMKKRRRGIAALAVLLSVSIVSPTDKFQIILRIYGLTH